MRLPWPFRRSAPDGDAPTPVAQGTVQPAMAPVRRDWVGTADLRPSFVADPGIRVQRFPDDIAGSQLPPPILAPLGHERSADGPAGLVTGLARPTLASVVQASAARSDLPLRPRRAAGPTARHSVTQVRTDDPGPPMHNEHAGAADVPAAAVPAVLPGPSVVSAAEGLPMLEPRRVPTVASAPTPRPGTLTIARTPDLTLAPARAATPDPALRLQGPRGAQPMTPAIVPPSISSGAPVRTILRTASGSRVRLGPPIERSSLEGAAPALELAHPGREAGPVPSATPVQRHPSPDASDGDRGGSGDPGSMAPLVGGLSATLAGEPLAGPAARDETLPGIPGGLVLARVVDTGRVHASTTTEAEAAPRIDVPGTVAPLVGASIAPASGLRPTVPSPMSATPASPEVPAPRMHGRSGVSQAASRQTAQRAAVAHIDRAVSTSGSAIAAARASQGHAPSPGVPRIQRIAQPAGHGPVGPGGPAAATRMPPALVLARSSTATFAATVASAHDRPAAEPGGVVGGVVTRATVLRDATDPATPDPAGPDDVAGAPSQAPEESLSASTPSRATPGAGPMAERDLDEMVRRLYPRLRRSLSSELLVARERAGTLADLR